MKTKTIEATGDNHSNNRELLKMDGPPEDYNLKDNVAA
jgi:hypothetical protein